MANEITHPRPTTAGDAPPAPCADCYRALLAACRDERYAGHTHDATEVARHVTAYARCARAEQVRPTRVLADLRSALLPAADRLPVPELMERAIDEYYQSGPLQA